MSATNTEGFLIDPRPPLRVNDPASYAAAHKEAAEPDKVDPQWTWSKQRQRIREAVREFSRVGTVTSDEYEAE
jgi:hypothetical protein